MAAKKAATTKAVRKTATKKAPTKKVAAPPPPARITKKDLEPDNKALTPAPETKGAREPKARSTKAPARYSITLIPPAGSRHPDDKRKALKPLTLPAGATDTDRDVAVTRAIQALQACTLKGTRVVVKSPAGGDEYVAELTEFGRINQVSKVAKVAKVTA